jgi:hypothetical protein
MNAKKIVHGVEYEAGSAVVFALYGAEIPILKNRSP